MKGNFITVYAELLLFLSGCTYKAVPTTGNHTPKTSQLTDHSFDQVWDKLIDLFAEKGLPIKIIDRSSGLIISERSILSTTIERKDGTLKYANAFIVIPQVYDPNSRK